MEEITVTSWTELNDRVYENSYRSEIGRNRSPFVFRGASRAEEPLLTSLARLGGDFGTIEHHLLRNFRKYAQRTSVQDDSVWNWLALAQHHGAPTRLLDWSFSPLVAMHFATANPERFDCDGVIWAIDFAAAHRLLPKPLRRVLEEEGSDIFTAEMLDRSAVTLEQFGRLAQKPFLLFFEPPSLDDRIVNQFALFSVMSSAAADLATWVEGHPGICRRIRLPASLKWEIRDHLDQANVTERVLFPGLDGLALWLKRYYAPRGGPAPGHDPVA